MHEQAAGARASARRLAVRLAWASALVLILCGAATASAFAISGMRLQGSFTMRGKLTFVDNVYGEHQGEHVQRAWTFSPHCAIGACKRVTLVRRRSDRHLVDVLVLERRGRGMYAGTGHFWVALLCAGLVIQHGGLAAERITVRITRTVIVGTTRFATALRATYTNPSRANLTRCPGGIGHDAAAYSGRLASTLPGPPTASFAATPGVASSTVAFTDQSRPGRGGAQIVAWSWNFGDPVSADNSSTQRSPTHQYSAPGTYSVTLRIRDRYGQTTTTTAQVTV